MRIEKTIHFIFATTNNEEEYKAFLARTRTASVLGATTIKIHMDSQLVAW